MYLSAAAINNFQQETVDIVEQEPRTEVILKDLGTIAPNQKKLGNVFSNLWFLLTAVFSH